MERFTERVLAHRRLVIEIWLVLLVAGGASASGLSGRLSADFPLPGQPDYPAEQKLITDYKVSSADTLVPAVTAPGEQTVTKRRADIAAVFNRVRAGGPQLRVVDLASSGGNGEFVLAGGRSTFALVQGPKPAGFTSVTEPACCPRSAPTAGSDLRVGVTSLNLLAQGGTTGGPSILVETLIAALGALAVLAFVFGSFLALVPLAVAAVSILTTFLLVLGLTYPTNCTETQ